MHSINTLRSVRHGVELPKNPEVTMSLNSDALLFLFREPLTFEFTSSPDCDLCGRPVKIESAVTDENGQAVHPACYLAAIKGSRNAL